MGAYASNFNSNKFNNFEFQPIEGDYVLFNIITANKLIYVKIYVKKISFEPYKKFYIPENSEYGRINHSYVQLEIKYYDIDTQGTATHYFYIDSEKSSDVDDVIQTIKNVGLVMTEGRVEEGYGNEYLGENKVFGKYIYEKYERK